MSATTALCARPGCERTRYEWKGTDLCKPHFQREAAYVRRGPSHPYPHHIIDPLLEQGYTLGGISEAAGLNPQHLVNISKKDCGVSTVTLRKLENLDKETIASQPAWRATRRVRALLANGDRLQDIQEATGLSRSALVSWSTASRKFCARDTFALLRDYYTEHELDLPRTPATRVLNAGWEPPMAWVDIDDPKEDRHGRHMVSAETVQGYVQTLRDEGMSFVEVGEVFGLSDMTVRKVMQRDEMQRKTRDYYMSAWRRYRYRDSTIRERQAA